MFVLFLGGTILAAIWVPLVTAIFLAAKWPLDPYLVSWQPRAAVGVVTWLGTGFFYREELGAGMRRALAWEGWRKIKLWQPVLAVVAILLVVDVSLRIAGEAPSTTVPISPAPVEKANPPLGESVATELRVSINAAGEVEEVSKKNVSLWRFKNPEILTFSKAPSFLLCADGANGYTPRGPLGVTLPTYTQEVFCLQKVKSWVFVIVFDKAISQRKVMLRGPAALPNWDNTFSSATVSVVSVHGELSNTLLTISVVD